MLLIPHDSLSGGPSRVDETSRVNLGLVWLNWISILTVLSFHPGIPQIMLTIPILCLVDIHSISYDVKVITKPIINEEDLTCYSNGFMGWNLCKIQYCFWTWLKCALPTEYWNCTTIWYELCISVRLINKSPTLEYITQLLEWLIIKVCFYPFSC